VFSSEANTRSASPQPWCMPENGTSIQAGRALVKYIQAHPETAHQRTVLLALFAYREAFPCLIEPARWAEMLMAYSDLSIRSASRIEGRSPLAQPALTPRSLGCLLCCGVCSRGDYRRLAERPVRFRHCCEWPARVPFLTRLTPFSSTRRRPRVRPAWHSQRRSSPRACAWQWMQRLVRRHRGFRIRQP